MSAMLLDAISRLTDRKVQFIINTSSSEAATGGNEAVRRAGITVVDLTAPGSFMPTDAAATAQLIAHENVLNRLVEARKPSSAWPTSTFLDGLEKSLYFNGEPIRMIPQPATTDGSAIVFFRRSDVIATGDLFLTDAYPRIDLARGGSVQGVIDGLNKVIDLAVPAHMEEGGTMIIPGRGRLCDRSDVVVYRDMVTIVRNRIAALKKRGQTLAQVQAARPTEDYDPLYGAESGDWTTAQFVEGVYSSIR